MPLGDSFPPELQEQQFTNCFQPGQIISLYCSFTNPPKNKFFVIASTRPLVLLFIVNSEVNDFIKNRLVLFDCQIHLIAKDYSFLDHDSYLACHEIINHFTDEQVRAQIVKDFSRHKGKITQQTRDDIINVLNKSQVLPL